MRKTFLSALAAAAILSGGMPAERAQALTPATPSALYLTATAAAPVQLATVLCGTNGCAPVQTKRIQRRKFHPLGHG